MSALVAGPGVFAIALTVHVALWRYRRPVAQYRTFMVLYIGVFVAALIGFVASSRTGILVELVPVTLSARANFAVLYFSLVAAFAVTYSAIQADSPTMTILLRIDDTGQRGARLEELLEELTDDVLMAPRLDDLLTGGLATLREGRYIIEPRGAALARTYVGFRRLMKMERGG